MFAFLEEYYNIGHGGDRKSSGNNHRLKTQSDIANDVGIAPETVRAYKRLASSIPEMQELLNTGKVTPTTALAIMRQLMAKNPEAVHRPRTSLAQPLFLQRCIDVPETTKSQHRGRKQGCSIVKSLYQ